MGDSSFGGGGHAASDLMEGSQQSTVNNSSLTAAIEDTPSSVSRRGQLSDWLSASGKLQCLLPIKLCS
jgi:hypothetical protein